MKKHKKRGKNIRNNMNSRPNNKKIESSVENKKVDQFQDYHVSSAKGRAAIVAIMKNEGPYIVEWVAHHLAIGFDSIIIYDNESNDNSYQFLSRLSKAGHISAIKWPSKPGQNKQAGAYNDAVAQFRDRFEWIAFIDADEFICPLIDYDINSFLDRFKNFSGVGIPWRVFGSSGKEHWEPGLVRDRFILASLPDAHPNKHVKTISQSDAIEFANVHIAKVSRGFVSDLSGNEIDYETRGLLNDVVLGSCQINHYFCKSKQEFMNKRARGRSGVVPGAPDEYRDVGIFDSMNYNDVEDISIRRFENLFRAKLKEIFPSVADLDLLPSFTPSFLDELRSVTEGDSENSSAPISLFEETLRSRMVEEADAVDQFGDPTHRKELIRMLLREGRWDEAEKLVPEPGGPGLDGWHHILFARALDAAGRHAEARAHWQAFAVNRPHHAEALEALSKKR